MDGEEVRLEDCIEQLKLLEAMGRVWAQDMILQMRDGYFQLIDIESKVRRTHLTLHSGGYLLSVCLTITEVILSRRFVALHIMDC